MTFSLTFFRYLFISILSISFVFASQDKTVRAFNSAQMTMTKTGSAPTQIHFSKGNEVAVPDFWQGYSKRFKLSPADEFKSFKTTKDKIGQVHHRYKQYYKGIEVADMQYILHEKNGLVRLANGKIIHGLNINTTPSMTESQALQMALDQLGAEKYMWESKKNEVFKKEISNDKNATYYPQGQLVLSSAGKKAEKQNFKLAYRFDIYAEKPSFAYKVDVDAHTGKILNKIPLYMEADVAGNGNTLYDGNVELKVSGKDFPKPPAIPPHWQLDSWNAYGGSGVSFRPYDPAYGSNGGYDNAWYDVMDTDPVALTGSELQLSFYHRHKVEEPDGAEAPYNGWDGMNIRISADGGDSWSILSNTSPAYDNSSLYSFGEQHAEGPNIPGWTGTLNDWTRVTCDLSAYAGQTVQIRFAFASDPAASTADGGGDDWFGWQVDNIEISNSENTLYSNTGDTTTVSRIAISAQEVTDISGNYRLREIERGGGIFTYDAKTNTSFSFSVDFVDDDSSFTDEEDLAGVNAHWSLENTYDYYVDAHGRASYDGNGSRVRAYIHWDIGWVNAQYLGNGLMRFGDADGISYGPLVSLDIVSHEFTHGVTGQTAGLIYQSEFGALNESFSDIFGAAVVNYTRGDFDWRLAGDPALVGVPFRSMSDPNSLGDPDTYAGKGWADPSNLDFDNGGVHINSGVQNYWFYLLVEGGSGTNDNGLTFDVQGIGWHDAEQIAYRNLSVYLTPTSEYADAREGSINAAIDLFGAGSQQVESVKQAWNAVGVAPSWAFSALGAGISGRYFKAGEGSVHVTTSVSNPSAIDIEVNAIIENYSKTVSDTIPMFDDGTHNDSSASDNIYGTSWNLPAEQDYYSVSIQVFSPDSNYAFLLRDVDRLTSVGPVVLQSFEQTTGDTVVYPGDTRRYNFIIQNGSLTDSLFNITTKSYALDTCALTIAFRDPSYGDIAPGGTGQSSRSTSILFYDFCPPDYTIPFVIEIYSDEYLFWADTFYITTKAEVTSIAEKVLPLEFDLRQNYPNPFNPETVINYSIKNAGKVELAIFDVTGKRVNTLVNKQQPAGEYSVTFNGANLPSGVYFYRITCGSFEQSRKMILIK